jgi:thiosulfate dehydrogenase [quinone] large subunit
VVAADLLNSDKHSVAHWNAAMLSKLPKSDFANDYAYNKFGPGAFGIQAKMGAAATVTLPEPTSDTAAGARYVRLTDVSGSTFFATLASQP